MVEKDLIELFKGFFSKDVPTEERESTFDLMADNYKWKQSFFRYFIKNEDYLFYKDLLAFKKFESNIEEFNKKKIKFKSKKFNSYIEEKFPNINDAKFTEPDILLIKNHMFIPFKYYIRVFTMLDMFGKVETNRKKNKLFKALWIAFTFFTGTIVGFFAKNPNWIVELINISKKTFFQ